MIGGFSPQSVENQRQSNDIFKALGMAVRNGQPKSPYAVKISMKNEGKIKISLDFF